MKYKLAFTNDEGLKIYAKIEDNGKSYLSCTENNQDFKDWVAAGNTTEAAD